MLSGSLNFFQKIRALSPADSFLLTTEAAQSFKTLNKDLLNAHLQSKDENAPFTVECDASDFAIAAIFSQNDRLVMFMSLTLTCSVSHYPANKKEAASIVEAVRKWSHYLHGTTFDLVTDQKSLAFIIVKVIIYSKIIVKEVNSRMPRS